MMKYILYALAALFVAAALLAFGHLLISIGAVLFLVSGSLGVFGAMKGSNHGHNAGEGAPRA